MSGPLLKPSEKRKSIKAFSRYDELKDQIRSWWENRFKVGSALLEIRDSKLYRDDYATFEEFCETEFGFKRAHAYRLMEFVEVKDSLKMSPMGDKIQTERQARALAPVAIHQREEVVKKASENGGSAQAIMSAAKTITTENGQQPKDKLGFTIPKTIESDWREAETFRETLNALHRIKLRIEKAIEDRELAFREITNSTVADLHNAWSNLERVLPYAVCPTCEGHNRKNCTLCKQRGWVSRFGYEHWVPKTTRALREKAVK